MPNAGDLIEIFRPAYQHWAIYVGNGYVIHLAPPSEGANAGPSTSFSIFCNVAKVKKEKLAVVVGTDRYRVNNLLDDEYIPRDVSEILKDAQRFVDHYVRYNLVTANCEHFVTDLRYGEPTSRQVQQAAIAGSLGVLGLIGLAAVLFQSGKEKKNDY